MLSPSSFPQRPVARRLLILLGHAALLLVFGWLLDAARRCPDMLMWDEAEYASIARSVVRGEGFSISGQPNSLRPPLWPLAIAARLVVSGDESDASLKVTTLVFVLLCILVVAVITTRLFDETTGWIAAICLGLMPEMWLHAGSLLSEPAFLAFFTLAVGGLYIGLHHDSRWLLISAAGAALALLTRYTALLLGPIAVVFAGSAVFNQVARDRWRSRWAMGGAATAMLLLIPWFVRQQMTFGNALIGVTRSSQQLLVYAPGVSMPWSFYVVGLPDLLSWPVAAAASAGVLWGVVRRNRAVLHIALTTVGLLVWFSVYRYKEPRLIAAVLPFCAMLAGIGIVQTLNETPARRWRLPLSLIAMFALGWHNVPMARQAVEQRVTAGFPIFAEALHELKRRCPTDGLILSSNVPVTAWYTDRRVEPLPAQGSELATRAAQANWIVITNFEAGQPAYAKDLAKQIPRLQPSAAQFMFLHDKQSAVALIDAPYLARHLRAEGP